MNTYTRIIDLALGILYPKRCVACDKVLLKIEKEVGFCRHCQPKIRLAGDTACMKCGAPLTDSRKEYCSTCSKIHHYYNQNKAIYVYENEMRNAMYRFKYSNKRCYGKVFAAHAAKMYGGWIKKNKIEAIIPVPMYKKKEKRRGYNQAEVFAKALSKETGLPLANKIIRRDSDTVVMKQLNGLKRKKNLLNAFSLQENVVQFRKVLIVDDIYTTGTTLDEVTKVLKKGGTKEVFGMTVCIGQVQ